MADLAGIRAVLDMLPWGREITVHLKDGSELSGSFVAGAERIELHGVAQDIELEDVEAISVADDALSEDEPE